MGSEPDERLLIDRSAAPSPSDEDLRAWAADRTVFVSSVMTGMKAERRETARAIEAVGAIPMLFEEFGGIDEDPEEAYLGKVASSDIYLGILGARYGKAPQEWLLSYPCRIQRGGHPRPSDQHLEH